MFPLGLEPRTFRVLGGCDSHYTTETHGDGKTRINPFVDLYFVPSIRISLQNYQWRLATAFPFVIPDLKAKEEMHAWKHCMSCSRKSESKSVLTYFSVGLAWHVLFVIEACVLGSIVVSIPACHAGDRGSIPRRGGTSFFFSCRLSLARPSSGLTFYFNYGMLSAEWACGCNLGLTGRIHSRDAKFKMSQERCVDLNANTFLAVQCST